MADKKLQPIIIKRVKKVPMPTMVAPGRLPMPTL
jgi:hypothetical protein